MAVIIRVVLSILLVGTMIGLWIMPQPAMMIRIVLSIVIISACIITWKKDNKNEKFK